MIEFGYVVVEYCAGASVLFSDTLFYTRVEAEFVIRNLATADPEGVFAVGKVVRVDA